MLYQVDDGAGSQEESVAMLEEAKRQGITAVILTPHYRHGMFSYPKAQIEANYSELKKCADKLQIDLYLGTEYHVNSHIAEAFAEGRCHTLADGAYVLTEYAYESEFSYMRRMTQELILHGYRPVIAHVERYGCMVQDVERAAQLRDMGAWIQVNADAVLGMEGWAAKRYCKGLLKEGWADIIASDSHGINKRACHMGKCYDYIERKYGRDRAELLLCRNPAEIISKEDIIHGKSV
jgi:protein-tyrosine phosphatase